MSADTADTAARKRLLRARIRAGRRDLSKGQQAAANAGLHDQLRELVVSRGATSISCYLPVPGEPDTRGFLAWAAEAGIEVLLPISLEGGHLDWVRSTGDATIEGSFGILEPVGERLGSLAVAAVDLMIVPAAAVDMRGHRLGWGRGYFDRTLAALEHRPPVFAVVHDHEVLTEVPTEPHDIPVTGVVTPEQVREFSPQGR